MLKFQAQKAKNSSGNLQLLIDTNNKIFIRGYFLTHDAITIGSKLTLNKIIIQLIANGFKEKQAGYISCYVEVFKARMAQPVNTSELERLQDLYGSDLYTDCLNDIITKYNLQ